MIVVGADKPLQICSLGFWDNNQDFQGTLEGWTGAHNVVGSPGPEHSVAAGGDERGRLLRGHRLKVLGALRALEKLLHILPACPKTCPNHFKTVAQFIHSPDTEKHFSNCCNVSSAPAWSRV